MRKTEKKIAIRLETVRLLQPQALAQAAGGLDPTAYCPMRNPRVQGG
jgi:hypothetical protein